MSDLAYTGHPIRSTVQQLLELKSDPDFLSALSQVSDDERWKIERVFEITRVVEDRLLNTPATLASSASLKNIYSLLQQAFAELSNFRTNMNAAHIANAESHVEGVIPQLAGFAAPILMLEGGGLAQLIGDLRAGARGVLQAISDQKDELAKAVSNLTTLVDNQTARIDELSATVETQKKEALAVSAEVRAEYSKTESGLRTQFDESLRTMKEEFESIKEATRGAAKTSLDELQRHQDQAKQIVQVVGNIGVTGNYQKIAASEGSAADNWRRVTIAFFAVGIILAVMVLISHLFPEVKVFILKYLLGNTEIQAQPASGWELVMRLLTAVAVTTPAFYTARESARHRTNSDRARQKELELASLGPFIELLPQEKKNEIIEKMTLRCQQPA